MMKPMEKGRYVRNKKDRIRHLRRRGGNARRKEANNINARKSWLNGIIHLFWHVVGLLHLLDDLLLGTCLRYSSTEPMTRIGKGPSCKTMDVDWS